MRCRALRTAFCIGNAEHCIGKANRELAKPNKAWQSQANGIGNVDEMQSIALAMQLLGKAKQGLLRLGKAKQR